MTHGSLFSGIGGFDLAAEWMGWENVFHCEWNDFGKKVLNYYWPKSISYHDITKTDFTIHRGTIDILTGGFPCQPYSQAGKRLGKEDERHLWPEMLRAIREIEPTWIVGENVRGLVSWSGGLVFEEVCADLEANGYEVQPFLLPAAGVNAPHKRDRIWFVANSRCINKGGEKESEWASSDTPRYSSSTNTGISSDGNKCRIATNTNNGQVKCDDVANTTSERLEGCKCRPSKGNGFMLNDWEKFPTVPPICNGDDGISDRLDSITFPKWRNESIKAGGNAIVPQVAHQIFKAIQNYESQTKLF